MLYLLGGASRAGKTIIAHRLLNEKRVPYLCLDYFVSALTFGAPELGVHHDQPNLQRSEGVWKTLRPMLNNIVEVEPRYLVEGDTLLPKYVRELSGAYSGQVRACFVGYTQSSAEQKREAIRAFGGGVNDWLADQPDDYVLELVGESIEFSVYLQDECAKVGIPFFDTSHDFMAAIDAAFQWLLAEPI